MADKLVRIDSSEVRGDGSFVTIKKPKWKELRKGLAVFQQAGGEANATAAAMEMMDALLPAMIVDWNWKDDDGKPLPLPSKNRESWDDMEAVDVMFLITAATPYVKFDRKN